MSFFGPGNTAMQPFLWGQGGERLTPEQIARQRAMADQQSAIGADFSPVGHWTQGAARLANAIGGKVQSDKLDKFEAGNRAESQSVAAALLGEDAQPDAVLGALSNPYVDPQVRELAMMQFDRMNPEPVKDPEIIRLSQIANDPLRPENERKAAADRIASINDPLIHATLPGDRFYSGPQSQLATIMRGGDPASSVGPGMEPPPEAVEELRQNPGTAAQFDEIFGAGAAARSLGLGGTAPPELGGNGMPARLTREQFDATASALGLGRAREWAARNGIIVEGM